MTNATTFDRDSAIEAITRDIMSSDPREIGAWFEEMLVCGFSGLSNFSDDDLMAELTDREICGRWVIQSTSEQDDDTGSPLEWSNELGWVGAGGGDTFDDPHAFDLPVGGKWQPRF